MGTEDALQAALERIESIFESLNVGITVRDIHVSTLDAAEATQLAVSPTIRINGRDIQPDYIENTCDSCGDLCACEGDVDCRLWRYRGKEHSTAPIGLIVESLVQAITSNGTGPSESLENRANQLSSNVRDFFEGSGSDDLDCGCGC